MLETLEFLSKKSYGAPIKLKHEEKVSFKVTKLLKLYEALITQLKENGALLNHIRPEFLLDYQELCYFIRTSVVTHAHPVTQKLKENEWRYLSQLSWSVLLTQIIKLFYVSRINL